MPTAVPSQRRGPARQTQTASSASTSTSSQLHQQQPAAHPTRLPAAPSSLRVQLPGSASSTSVNRDFNGSHSHTPRPVPLSQQQRPRPQTSSSSSASARLLQQQRQQNVASTSASPSDVTLLAQGIREQQRKAKEILAWQEKLMEDRDISREELKRALTRLSIPLWLQVLQERSLGHICGYPTCRNRLSPSATSSASSRPRYRISVSRHTIERDTSNDAGGRNNFCSKQCHAKSEWVRRWVLNPAAVETNSAAQRGQQMAATYEDPVAARMREIGEEQALQGGKWEALMNCREDQWEEIELLEDMQEDGQLDDYDDWSRDGRGSESGTTVASAATPVAPRSIRNAADPEGYSEAAGESRRTTSLANRLGSMTISERPHNAAAATSANSEKQSSLADESVPRRYQGSSLFAGSNGGDTAVDDFESLFGLGSSSNLQRDIVSANRRVTSHPGGPEAGRNQEDDQQGELTSPPLSPASKKRLEEEDRMLDEAMMLRDQLRESGEMED